LREKFTGLLGFYINRQQEGWRCPFGPPGHAEGPFCRKATIEPAKVSKVSTLAMLMQKNAIDLVLKKLPGWSK